MKDNLKKWPRPDMNHASDTLLDIKAEQLVCMDDYIWEHPIAVQLDYAQENNLLFGERIYKTGAKLWLFQDLAKVVIEAARLVYKETGGVLVLYDGLRVSDAQHKMLGTQRVKNNPQWLEAPRLLSPPGAGGHPRGMAADVSIIDRDGVLFDMGTPFDFLAADPAPLNNPAHREHVHCDTVVKNRAILDQAMMQAADTVDVQLVGLPQEWWDYRLPSVFYEQYAPLSDEDLPAHMRLME